MGTILVVDIGNSFIKIGLFDKDDNLLNKYLLKTNVKCSKKFLNELLIKNFGKYKISSSVIGSVVPKQTENFVKSIKEIFNLTPYLLSERTKTSFSMNNIKRENIADDILALAEYCYRQNKTSMGVSFGTAAFAIYLEKGVLLGACIAPGIGTSFNKLLDRASLIKIKKIDKSSRLNYGINTEQALNSGFNIMRTGFVMAFYYNVNRNKKPLTCIVSGGEANILNVNFEYIINENAILYGFKYIYELNNKN